MNTEREAWHLYKRAYWAAMRRPFNKQARATLRLARETWLEIWSRGA